MKKAWREAMYEEINNIKRNQTWELVDPLTTKQPIDVKWVFKLKLKPNGSIAKHKTRLVARGFFEKTGDVKSTFLNDPLEEEAYVLQPSRFEVRGSEHKYTSYAPRAWNKRIDVFLS
ncbi:hypothetical protein CR513_08340, partial [Mucuna pruriens]